MLVRPENLVYYANIGIHHFKLQGRQAAKGGDSVPAVASYMEGNQ